MNTAKETLLVLGLVMAVGVCVTNSLPTRHVARLKDILTDLRTLQDRNAVFSDERDSELLKKRHDGGKDMDSFDLLIQLNDPVKIQEVPALKAENSLSDSDDVISGMDKRQGRWDLDYGLGGGRFGKRGYDDYVLGGGRFGRDVDHVRDIDHVDLDTFED